MSNANLEIESTRTRSLAKTAVSTRMAVPLWLVVCGATALGGAIPVAVHFSRYGVLNPHQIALSFFLFLNAVIAFWEICLFFRIELIHLRHEEYRDSYRGRENDRVIDLLTSRIPLSGVFSPDRWADVWASYSLFDDAYADRKSFGFFIDIGNGFTTLIPSLLIPWAVTFELLPARALGVVTLVLCYQMFYGACLYLASFVINERYRGRPPASVALFVGLSNGVWTIFPLWMIGVAIWLISHGSFSIFRG